jgi:GR25 family glycosyltransferase involved in LPS biosynthesis
VSLRSETARRASVEQQMASLGTDFRWWDAVDGTKALPDDEVRWYVSGSRLKQYKRRAPGSQEWRKIACDLSHLRLMHDMVASGRDIQVVLEDDVQLLGDFKQRLNATLAALPADWDVLWLNHGAPIQRKRSNLRGWVGPGLRMFTDNSATVGMVYRRSFALVVGQFSVLVNSGTMHASLSQRDVSALSNC